MELVEHRRGVQRLGNEDVRATEDETTCVNRNDNRGDVKDRENDRDTMSDCGSETSEVLSVGSEPTPANDDLVVEEKDDHNGSEHYESDAESKLSVKVVDSGRDREETPNGKSILRGSTPSSRSPSPSLSSSASCDPPQSPASNYCTTSPQNRASPSSPAASSVRSPASSSATASSPSRPDAHQEAIVPRYQSASISGNIHHHNLHHQHHHHLLSNSRYAAAALITTCRDSNDRAEYSSVMGSSTLPRIPVHHPISLTAVSHGTSAVADLIGYTQQSIDLGRSLHSRVPPTLNVPLVTRLSLSPPTAMAVTGLQANAPSTAFHPVAVAAAAAAAASCRDPRETNPLLIGHPAHLQHSGHGIPAAQHSLLQQQGSAGASQIQHAPPPSATVLHHHHHQQQHHHHHHHGSHNSRRNPVGNQSSGQHRLSVSKLLQQNDQDSSSMREGGSPPSPETRGADDHHRQSHRHSDGARSNSSSGNGGSQNSPCVPTSNNDHHRSNNNDSASNNNNNMQHQASLKFSIDNILKADFGRRITDPISLKKSRTKKVVPRPIDLTKDFRETSSESSERGSETSTTALSPGATSTINTSCTSVSNNVASGVTTTGSASSTGGTTDAAKQMLWPAWVYCTRYSDRPSSGRSPRTRRVKRTSDSRSAGTTPEEKRPRTAFSGEQLARLKREFGENRYLTERRRQQLSRDLGLNEAQIKIWFQNKRAKIKKASGQKNPLALQLMAQGLYNHSTVPLTKEEEEQAAELQAK